MDIESRRYLDGAVEIYCGDCLDIMPYLPAVDHTISDPPYERTMHAAKVAKNGRKHRTDDGPELRELDFPPIDQIRQAVCDWTAEITQKWVIYFCTPEGVAPWRDAIEAAEMRYKRACHWIKPDAAPQFNGQGPAYGAEMFVTAWAGEGVSVWNAGGRSNIYWHVTRPRGPRYRRDGRHATEKPLPLFMEIMDNFTLPEDVILDPFAGSGTTGLAAIMTGRRFVGIEKEPAYFDIMCERIERVISAPDMFIDVTIQEKLQLEGGGNERA